MRRLVIAAFILLSACSSGEELASAEKEIVRFHTDLSAGKGEQIHDRASADWKQATAKPDAVQLFSGVRSKLGKFVSGKQEGWRVNYTTNGTIIIVQYNSKFEKAEGVETFTFKKNGDGAQLVGYNINSKALITG
jgi:hypothetical protein